MSETNKALVPANGTPAAMTPNSPQAALAMFGGDEQPVYCSFDLNTPEGKALYFRAAQGDPTKVFEVSGQVIDLVHVYASYAEKNGKAEGEVIPLTRIVLVDAKGDMFGCFSKGIKKSIRQLVGVYGLPPFKPPVRVKVKLSQVGGGKNFLTLEPAPAESGKEAKR